MGRLCADDAQDNDVKGLSMWEKSVVGNVLLYVLYVYILQSFRVVGELLLLRRVALFISINLNPTTIL